MNISPLIRDIYSPAVQVSQPQLTGSDYRYKWLSRSQQMTETEAISVLSSYVHSSSSPSSLPVIRSSRFDSILNEIASGRLENAKQLVITDSEVLTHTLSCYLHKQGLSVIELHAIPDSSSPQTFLSSQQVAWFNSSSPATIAMVCLPSFLQSSSSSILSSVPVVSRIIVAEKPFTPTSQTLYHNLLLALSAPINRHARIIEIFSETESRLQLRLPRSEVRDEKLEICRDMLNGLRKREKKQLICEILNENEWNSMEEYHQNRDFLFPSNESRYFYHSLNQGSPCLSYSSHLIMDEALISESFHYL